MSPRRNWLTIIIQQTCDWPFLGSQAKELVRYCKICNKLKKVKPKYGKLSTKKVEVEPWAQVDIDLICPHTIKTNEVYSKVLPIKLTLVDMLH